MGQIPLHNTQSSRSFANMLYASNNSAFTTLFVVRNEDDDTNLVVAHQADNSPANSNAGRDSRAIRNGLRRHHTGSCERAVAEFSAAAEATCAGHDSAANLRK